MFIRHLAVPLALALCAIQTPGFAQTFPSRPVTLVVPFPPGGGTDTGGRVIAEQLGRRWGQPVIVENKGGAAGQIGADFVAKSRPDGYTLLLGNIGTQAINPLLYSKLPYDADKAFAPVSLVAELPLAMMVNPAVPAKTAADFVALARSRPGQMSYSSSGAGGAPHLAAEMFKDQTGAFIVHVPYRGGGPAIADLLAGHVQLSFMTVLEASGHIKAGKLRALAVTGDKRVPAFPDVPTLAESVAPGFNAISWIGLLAPAGTPPELVEKIAADLRAVLADESVKARFVGLGGVPRATSPQEFARLIDDDKRRYAQIIRSRKITIE
ncbi:tripartite-type tricarboxylate transporter receptor subunit TctC [Variovorax paradoxus]|uniref:Tripartite-type tricarboxylate transporter receptor subunit TctC n=1 Tax=Variovorax paradoxus TaxID=34073 RepID=A0AAE3Y1U1_VARPD|nr:MULTISPECIES: tripartite tricarboxylate transporter substrate binding protein [Variovorax]MDR6428905.1 tripartite-type tricarboxylate transporter receptor subunit TctC [Variovorax paradoxus]MDR6455769.1 tripartite-type tricarboxylate transporter receptor subunit TctC [Variovorax paradoxus]